MSVRQGLTSFRELGGLRALEFESLRAEGIPHAVYTRHGGFSEPPYQSLNLSLAVGDDPGAVAANRTHIMESFPAHGRIPVETRQVHGANIVTAEAVTRAAGPPRADGVISDRSDHLLTMRFADCVPIIMLDRARGAIGLGHAGWRGTASGIAHEMIDAMGAAYGTRPADLLVALGPSICATHYPVGPQVREALAHGQGSWALEDFHETGTELHFDLVQANRRQLLRAGVLEIETSELCTACHVEDWFSHRAEGGRTGRFGVYIALPRA